MQTHAISAFGFPLYRTRSGQTVEVEDEDMDAGGCAIWLCDPATLDRITYFETDESFLDGAVPIPATVH